ncbi:unnamed protein product [Closterium sp. NIES-54]
MTTEFAHVAESGRVAALVEVAASCSCRLLTHQTLLFHHRLGHPSLPRLHVSLLLPSSPPPQFPGTPPASLPGCRTPPPPPVAPLPPHGPTLSGVSQVDPSPLV